MLINEHDKSKEMMKIIKEMQNSGMKQNIQTNEEVGEEIELSSNEIKSEEEGLRQQIDASLKITTYTVYPDNDNVVLEGIIQGMGNLEFQFTLEEEDGLFITSDAVKVNSSFASKIQRLHGSYENWRGEWFESKLNDYKK